MLISVISDEKLAKFTCEAEGSRHEKRHFGRKCSFCRNELSNIECFRQQVLYELTSRVFTQDKMRDKKTVRTREGGKFLRAVLVECFTVAFVLRVCSPIWGILSGLGSGISDVTL